MARTCKSLARWWGFALVVALLAAQPTRAVPATLLFALSGLGPSVGAHHQLVYSGHRAVGMRGIVGLHY
jgi:hypothetical protein